MTDSAKKFVRATNLPKNSSALRLNRRAWNGPVGAKDAAVAKFRLQAETTPAAVINWQASVGIVSIFRWPHARHVMVDTNCISPLAAVIPVPFCQGGVAPATTATSARRGAQRPRAKRRVWRSVAARRGSRR